MRHPTYHVTFSETLPNGKTISATHQITRNQYLSKFNFYRCGRSGLLRLCRAINSPKSRIIGFLVKNMSTTYNSIPTTISNLAKHAHTNRVTTTTFIKKCEKCHLLKYHNSIIYISPELIMKGNDSAYDKILGFFLRQ